MMSHLGNTFRLFGAALLLALLPSLAHGYWVEEDSTGNRLEVVLENWNLSAPLVGITVDAQMPWFCNLTAPITIPVSVAAAGSSVVVVEFDVPPGVALSTSGDITLTVGGTMGGAAIESTMDVALVVAASAPPSQETEQIPWSVPAGSVPAGSVPAGSPLMRLLLALTLVFVFVLWQVLHLRGEARPR